MKSYSKAADRDLRSFGRKRGRRPSARQAALVDERLPDLALDLTRPPAFPPDRPLWLEIGFGGGEHLVWQAARNPQADIIGCEPFVDGVVKAVSAIEAQGLGNVRLHADDARSVLRWLPPASIDRAFVLFPDPWPKRRHLKRRLVNASTLAMIARALRPGGELRLATDIADYARTMLIALQATPELRWRAAGPDDWRMRSDDWPQTRYEAKAHAAGRRCYFFRIVRV